MPFVLTARFNSTPDEGSLEIAADLKNSDEVARCITAMTALNPALFGHDIVDGDADEAEPAQDLPRMSPKRAA